MSKTLNLCDHLLLQVRKFQSLGVDHRALRILGNLSRLGDLPTDAAEETQVRMAELLLKQSKFARARRHLTAALAHQEDNAQYHYLMAWAVESDRRGQPARALHHYQRCVELDQDNPHYHADAGLFALGHRQVEQGLGWLRRAVALAPDDVEVVAQVLRGLLDAGHTDEARKTARAALFRNSGDRRFRQLWNDFRFQELHQEQQQTRKQRYIRGAIAEGRICLSFQQMTVETASGRRVVRQDGPSHRPAPHYVRLARLSERKHA
jgi:tetratricopeptide (TPR) repeat protein